MRHQKQYQSHDGFNYRLLGKSVDLSSIIHAVVAASMISFCFDKNGVLSREVAGVPFLFLWRRSWILGMHDGGWLLTCF
jgi:hypothetical protein